MNSLIDNAIEYAKAGYHIFPCKGKIPLTQSGFKDATNNVDQIKKWWEDFPKANIGLVTGKVNDLVVIDVDVKDEQNINGYESLEKLEGIVGPLRPTLEVITGSGGLHLYFKNLNGLVFKSRTNILPGIDVRGDGGYVIAPPSIHPKTQKEYIWKF